MISFKDELAALEKQAQMVEERDRLAGKCLELWRQTVKAVETFVFPLFPGAARSAEEDWQQLQACIELTESNSILETAPRLAERILHEYAQRARRIQQEELEALKGMLEVMATAASSSRSRTAQYGSGVETVCQSLGRIAKEGDLETVRKQLLREAAKLRDDLARMVRANEDSLRALEGELGQFRERLAAAETAAVTDPLTGLVNRRELDRQLEARIRDNRPFCALLFDVDAFKSINDRFGHDGGDAVLRRFAEVLSEQARPGDVVARWGGDEFVVILACGIQDAIRRSQQISERLSRRYELPLAGRPTALAIRASAGVAQHVAGESAADLLRRADQAMYAAKAQRTSVRLE